MADRAFAPGGSRKRVDRIPLALWCLLTFAVGAKAIASPHRHSVWPVFAASSEHWLGGQLLYAYYPGQDMYRYSPTFAVAATPLALLPMRIGGCLWGGGGVLLLFAALRALHRDVLADRTNSVDSSLFLSLAALGAAPMAWNLQSNALVLALIAYGTVAAARGRWWWAAAFLAAPVFIKLWPLAWAGVVAIGRPRQIAPRLGLALAAMAAIPFLTAAPEEVVGVYRQWWIVLNAGEGLRWPGYRDILTLWELTGFAFDPFIHRLAQVGFGCAVVIFSIVVEQRTGSYRSGLMMGLSAWMCWQLLLGPASERNTYGVIVPLMAWSTIQARRESREWIWPGAMLVVVLLFAFGEVERALAYRTSAAAGILPAAVLGFAAWIGYRTIRDLMSESRRPVEGLVVGPIAVRADTIHQPDRFCETVARLNSGHQKSRA